MIESVLRVSQLVSAVVMTIAILLQQQGAGMGAGFGDTGGGFKTTRRGVEKTLYNITIVVSILFFTTSLLIVII
ncbi:MAG: preprotein translocase subunit SecG [Candidatus Magasanikbacteria bacterium]